MESVTRYDEDTKLDAKVASFDVGESWLHSAFQLNKTSLILLFYVVYSV